jgi:hypothetical protein
LRLAEKPILTSVHSVVTRALTESDNTVKPTIMQGEIR